MARTLVLVLGDQVGERLPALDGLERDATVVLLCEVRAEVDYAPHHAKKLALIFSAMRHRAADLEDDGWTVDYVRLDDDDNRGSLPGELDRALGRHGIDRVRVTEPGEYRVRRTLDDWGRDADVEFEWVPDDRFLCSVAAFEDWARGRRSLRMEYFYREMRREHDVLMEGDEPVGGRWNFDHDNRESLPPPMARPRMPSPMAFTPDDVTEGVLDLVERECEGAFGELRPFHFAVTPGQARRALAHFVEHALPDFGKWQDAMATGEDWLFHGVLSMYLNCGLLDPRECIRAAEQAWHDGHAPINAVEGFVRQILGWREFVRGVYWLHMPDYADRNRLQARLDLPEFYWTGETGMRCVAEAVRNTRENAYAHHIQRLMVTGNFALIAGIQPKQVCDWYLGVYADAYEWVELPNVVGMALFADGGVFASKPYAASGKYIDRMSDHCADCRYDPKRATGEDACPFNYLYWDFLARQEKRLAGTSRMNMIYGTLRRMDSERVTEMRRLAKRARKDLDAL